MNWDFFEKIDEVRKFFVETLDNEETVIKLGDLL